MLNVMAKNEDKLTDPCLNAEAWGTALFFEPLVLIFSVLVILVLII